MKLLRELLCSNSTLLGEILVSMIGLILALLFNYGLYILMGEGYLKALVIFMVLFGLAGVCKYVCKLSITVKESLTARMQLK